MRRSEAERTRGEGVGVEEGWRGVPQDGRGASGEVGGQKTGAEVLDMGMPFWPLGADWGHGAGWRITGLHSRFGAEWGVG